MNFKTCLIPFAILVLISCKKKEVEAPCNPVVENSILVLNEGLFQQNNATLSQINIATGESQNDYFQTQVGRPLGDTGNDMKRYGGKIYIVMNVSSTIEVLDANTGLSVKQIEMKVNNVGKQPRFIDFYGSNAFVSCFDGYVDVIDTSSLEVTQRIAVGSNPDHLKVAGAKVYVSNSGGLNYPNVDSTISVISASSLTEIKRITVGGNPGSIAVANTGNVFVITRGDFGTIPSRMHRIETAGDTKAESYSFDASSLTSMEGDLLVFETTGTASIKKFNTSTNTLDNTDCLDISSLTTPYSIQYNALTKQIFVMDANSYVNSGKVYEYSQNGNFIRTYSVGLIPSSLIVL